LLAHAQTKDGKRSSARESATKDERKPKIDVPPIIQPKFNYQLLFPSFNSSDKTTPSTYDKTSPYASSVTQIAQQHAEIIAKQLSLQSMQLMQQAVNMNLPPRFSPVLKS